MVAAAALLGLAGRRPQGPRQEEPGEAHGQAYGQPNDNVPPVTHAWPMGGIWIDAQTASPQAPRSSSLTQPSMEGE